MVVRERSCIQCDLVTLILTLSSKNRKIENESKGNENRRDYENKLSLLLSSLIDYAIELIPGLEPKSSKIYSLSWNRWSLMLFSQKISKLVCICLSKLPIAVFVFFIKKKDGLLWLVQDYCVLNSITIKNQYPLLLISELIS